MTPNERLTMIVKNFWREINLTNELSSAGYWLNRFHQEMDQAEDDGMDISSIGLPQVQSLYITGCDDSGANARLTEFFSHNSIAWGQHKNVDFIRLANGETCRVG